MLQVVAYVKNKYKNFKNLCNFLRKTNFCSIKYLTTLKKEGIFISDETDC